ncbi:MAG: helix-hairpin-helix domain-containing protein [Desulfuromonadaceae bacterium]|nr:helix-hairpin-helix domain-containing protein [Desulfuromonadaceae bacterium]
MSQDYPVSTASHVLSDDFVTVKMCGDLRHPGIYRFSANLLAESVTLLADLCNSFEEPLNITANRKVQNGSSIRVLLLPDGNCRMSLDFMTVNEQMLLGIPLDITRMKEDDFDRLPGIGASLAKRIVEYRQNNGGFMRVEDLSLINGIGNDKYNGIKVFF